METRYFNVTCARYENQVVIPVKKAVGEVLCATPQFQRNSAPNHRNVIDFTAYREALLEREAEELSTQEEEFVDSSPRLSLKEQISLSLEFIATGGILAMAVTMVMIFI